MRGVSHVVLQLTPGMVGETKVCVNVCVYSVVGVFEGVNQTLN